MKRLLLLATFLGVAGCAALHSTAPAAQTYWLRVAPAAAPAAAGTPVATLQVERPQAAAGLSSERIVIVQPDHHLSYYAGSQWAAELPRVVGDLALQRLRASGDWAAVNDAESAFVSDYFLQISIGRFEAEYTGSSAPTAQVRLDSAIGRRAARTLIASFSVQAAVPASANRVSAVVAALEEAANQALNELAARSAAAVKNPQGPSAP